MASTTMLAPPKADPARISQLLPTVKCSNCNQPVPLAELGEHICAPPPPVPSLPKPSIPPQGVNALLPDRLKGRVASPGLAPQGPIPPVPQQQHQRLGSAASGRLRINSNISGTNGPPPRSSPLARSESLEGADNSGYPNMQPPPRMDARMRNNSMPSPSGLSPRDTYNAPSRTGTPLTPNSPPIGLPGNPRSPASASTSPRLPFNSPPPVNRSGPSPAPSFASMNRNVPSPGPSVLPPGGLGPRLGMQRGPPPPVRPGMPPQGPPPPVRPGMPPQGPPPVRPGMPPQQGPSLGPLPPRPGPPPASAPVRTGSPFINDPRMSPAPFNVPQRSYTPGIPPGQVMAPPPPPGTIISESGIDTKTGGEAGMAGVGRRGFAAAARAAMFAAAPRPMPSQAPSYPGADTSYTNGKSIDGPPKSPNLSSLPDTARYPGNNMARLPTPPTKIDTSVINPSVTQEKTPIDREKTPLAGPQTPASPSPFGIRLPFFEKLRNMVPSATSPSETTTPTTATPANAGSNGPPSEPSDITHMRSVSTSSKASSRPREDRRKSPAESEYSGLAYAASEDDDDSRSRGSTRSTRSFKRSSPPPPLPRNAASRARAGSAATPTGRVLLSTSPDTIDGVDQRSGIPIGKPGNGRPSLSRNNSVSSSYSSASSVGNGRKRTNSSAAIAQALGLSQTPPSDYAKLGGPGVPSRGSRPLGRSISNSSSHSAYSRTGSMAPANGTNAFDALERSLMKIDQSKGTDLAKSKSTGTQNGKARTANGSSISGSVRGTEYTVSEADTTLLGYAKRSKTVQGVTSPENKPVKLPTRAKTTTAEDRSSTTADGTRVKKKREKVCVKCRKKIDDGRWIQVDSGSILCEQCWKNMYLPKCRRCNLPIEKQAVSSSDGQLKGKYHKECFNCHTCKKPFPDKTFYVFDGKPFCAYHYHEANDSLCAAARCGQPIEGPCAVSHAGDRYHPECMTCEYPGYPECRERLEEYWEVDGRMLCEHHATMTNEDDYDSQWAANSKAMKRVTRFIDLTGGAGGNNNDPAAQESDSGLR